MTLPSSTIRGLIEGGMIRPTPPDDRLNNIEGNAYDLTLESIYVVTRPARDRAHSPYREADPSPEIFIGVNERWIPTFKALRWGSSLGKTVITCHPGLPYIFQTAESVIIPPTVEGEVIPRSTVFRSGAYLASTWVPFGFVGQLFVGVGILPRGLPITWEKGARFCALKFHRLESSGVSVPYTGIWGEDRATTDGQAERAF